VRTLAEAVADWGYARYDAAWLAVERAGRPALAIDTRWRGRRYASLNALILSPTEAK